MPDSIDELSMVSITVSGDDELALSDVFLDGIDS